MLPINFESIKKHKGKIALATVAFGVFIFLYIFIPPVWRLGSGTIEVTQWRRGYGRQVVRVGPGRPNWMRLQAVSKHVLHTVIVAEDARFYSHHGLDFGQIRASLEKNYRQKRYARGASTITQQVVKMTFLSRDKTLVRKVREAMGALLLEMFLSKNKILEWYLNLAEFGDGVYGIKASAWHYFHTKPELITIQQAVHLAIVLPSPNVWSKGLRSRSLTPFGHMRYAQIAHHLRLAGYITRDQWLNILATGDFGRPVNSYNQILAKLGTGNDIEETLKQEEFLKEPASDVPLTPGDVKDSEAIDKPAPSPLP